MAVEPIAPGPAAAAPGEAVSAPAIAPVAAPVAAGSVAAPAPAAPVADAPAAPVAAPAVPAAPAGDKVAPAADKAAPAAKEGAAAAPGNEFKPSVLDAAVAGDKPAGDKPADPKADPKKAADGKPAEAAKPAEAGKEGAAAEAPPAPIEYAFTYPEGIKPESIDKERMSAFTGILNDGRVDPAKGQQLLDLHLTEVGEAVKKLAQQQWDVFNSQQDRWREEVKAHPVLGGARHQTAIREIMSVVDQYGGEAQERQALLDAFRTTGIANNPAFLMFLHRASSDLTREATPHPAPPPRSQAPSREQRGLNRYSKTTPGANGAGR
jgi:hypothetical protein